MRYLLKICDFEGLKMPKFPDEFFVNKDGLTAFVSVDFTDSFVIQFPVKKKGLNNPLRPAENLKVFSVVRTENWTIIQDGLTYNQAAAYAKVAYNAMNEDFD